VNFADERYVRVYQRDTKTWLRLGWEGQAVLVLLMRKVDRSGVYDDVVDLAVDVALVTGVPLAIVVVAVERLLFTGTIEQRGDQLVLPRFLEGQTATKSDRLRAQESRERRRDEVVSSSNAANSTDPVTIRDGSSRAVTPRHAPSRAVTPSLAQPSSAQPSLAERDPDARALLAGIGNGGTGSGHVATGKASQRHAAGSGDPPASRRGVDVHTRPEVNGAPFAVPAVSLRIKFRGDWQPTPDHIVRAQESGILPDRFHELADHARLKDYPRGFSSEDDVFMRALLFEKTDAETRTFKADQKAERRNEQRNGGAR
jgi:hypothetical protein